MEDSRTAAEVIARYESDIRRWFSRKVADSDAEDLAQDTACAIIESYPRFRGGSSERTWVYAICRNMLYRYYRRSARQPVTLEPDELSEIPADRSLKIAVSIAADRLPTRLRTVYDLRFARALTVREISDRLKRPVGTVKYQLHEIRLRLKRYLHE